MALTLKRVLVLLDGTDEAFEALDQAVDLAGTGGEVYAVQVQSEPETDSDYIRNALHADPAVVETSAVIAARLDSPRYRNVRVTVENGDAADAIVRAAEASNSALIVLPSPKETRLQRLRRALRGSLVDRVTRSTRRPVLVSACRHAS